MIPSLFESLEGDEDHAFVHVCQNCAQKYNLVTSDSCCNGNVCLVKNCQNNTSLIHSVWDYRENNISIVDIKNKLINDINELLPATQEYFNDDIPFFGAAKWLDQDGNITFFNNTQTKPNNVCDLPIESLLTLKQKLQNQTVFTTIEQNTIYLNQKDNKWILTMPSQGKQNQLAEFQDKTQAQKHARLLCKNQN